MTVKVEDVLKVDFVLVGLELLNDASAYETFRDAVGTDVVVSGHGVSLDARTNVTEFSRSVSLNRDRITLDLSPSRSTIRREYPSEAELRRLAEVSGHAIGKTTVAGQHLRAFGYNLELVYDQDSGEPASKYLADRLFSSSIPIQDDWELIGGGAKMVYNEGGNQWQFTTEARFNEPGTTKVFLNLNLHKDQQEPPTPNQIENHLQAIWDQAHLFASLLDGGTA